MVTNEVKKSFAKKNKIILTLWIISIVIEFICFTTSIFNFHNKIFDFKLVMMVIPILMSAWVASKFISHIYINKK